MRSLLLVGLGGSLGACARYGVGLLSARWFGDGFPFGTLLVNVVGSFLLGWLLTGSGRLGLGEPARLLLGTGVCGALTTFSTFSVETLRLVERGNWTLVLAYLGGNVVLGLGAAALGMAWGKP